MAPTPTLPQGLTRILARQQQATTTVLVAGDTNTNNTGSTDNSGLSGGAIAGIVIGTIVGILIIWWIVRSLTQPSQNRGGPDPSRQGWYDDTVPPASGSQARSRSVSQGRHHHHHHGHYRHSSHRHHSGRRHSSSRRRSSTPRPVVIEEKYAAVPRRPEATYVYPSVEAGGRRSRSRSQGRYYVSG